MIKYVRMAFVIIISFYFLTCISKTMNWHFIDNVNLIFHEAGHTIFFFLGQTFRVFAGSWFQVLLPLCISIYFFFTQQFVSGSVSMMWTGQNLISVSVYIRDSIVMQLPLLGGDSSIHDWNYLLSQFDLLKYTYTIADTTFYAGAIIIISGIIMAVMFVSDDNLQERKNLYM